MYDIVASSQEISVKQQQNLINPLVASVWKVHIRHGSHFRANCIHLFEFPVAYFPAAQRHACCLNAAKDCRWVIYYQVIHYSNQMTYWNSGVM